MKSVNTNSKISRKQTTLRFIVVGGVGALVELVLFSTILRTGIGVAYSNVIAFHCAFSLCFLLHYQFTYQRPFEGKRNIVGGFMQYAALMYGQLAISSWLLWYLIDKSGWVPEIAKIIQIGIVTPISYVVQKLIIFRNRDMN